VGDNAPLFQLCSFITTDNEQLVTATGALAITTWPSASKCANQIGLEFVCETFLIGMSRCMQLDAPGTYP